MIRLKNLFEKEKIDITLPEKLEDFEIHLDENKCTYSEEFHNGARVHVFSGPIKDNEYLELEVFYDEDKEELSFISEGNLNTYNKDGEHIVMS